MLVPLTIALVNAPSLWVALHCSGGLGLTRPLKTHSGSQSFCIVWASWRLTRNPENAPWKHIQTVSGSTSFEQVDNWQGSLKTHPESEWFYIVWASWWLTMPPENTSRLWVVLHHWSELITDKAPWKHIQIVSGSTSFERVDDWQGPLKTHTGREWFCIVWASWRLTRPPENTYRPWVALHCLSELTTDKALWKHIQAVSGSTSSERVDHWQGPPENTSRPWVVLPPLSELTTDKAPWKHIQDVSGSTSFERVDDWQGPLKTRPESVWFYIVWASRPLTRPPENTSRPWVVRLNEFWPHSNVVFLQASSITEVIQGSPEVIIPHNSRPAECLIPHRSLTFYCFLVCSRVPSM